MLWVILGTASAVAVAAVAAFFLSGSGKTAIPTKETPAASLPAPVVTTDGTGHGPTGAGVAQQAPDLRKKAAHTQEAPKTSADNDQRSDRKGKRLASKDPRHRERQSRARASGRFIERDRTGQEAERMHGRTRSTMPDGSFTKGLSPE